MIKYLIGFIAGAFVAVPLSWLGSTLLLKDGMLNQKASNLSVLIRIQEDLKSDQINKVKMLVDDLIRIQLSYLSENKNSALLPSTKREVEYWVNDENKK